MERLGRIGARMGVGMLAGVAGTALMTAAQKIEMDLADREPSTTAADLIDELTGLAPEGESDRLRLSKYAHWGYGAGLGAARGALASTPLPPAIADTLFGVAVWAAPMAYLPALDLAPPVSEWNSSTLAKDAFFHALYAGAVVVAWRLLTRRDAVVST